MNALYIGSKIKESRLWKNIDLITNFIAIIITAIVTILKVFNVPFFLNDDQIIIISGALAALILAFHALIAILTSDKIGIERRKISHGLNSLEGMDRRKPKDGK